MWKLRRDEVVFEDSLGDDWSHDLSIAEVPIGNRPLFYLGIVITAAVLAIGARIIYLNWSAGAYFTARAEDNVVQYEKTPGPRGVIYDREGDVLAEDTAAFAAVLDTHDYITNKEDATQAENLAETVLGVSQEEIEAKVASSSAADFAVPVVLSDNLTSAELVSLRAASAPAIKIESDFIREYPMGSAFSSVLGYTGRVNKTDLSANPSLGSDDFIGKAGVEKYYDSMLRGKPGINVEYENALGKILYNGGQTAPQAGDSLHLTIDGGLQEYFYNRLAAGLSSLGRTVGLGIAMNPQTGEVLSLVNLPGYDNNIFSQSGTSTAAQINKILNSPDEPLFDRAVSGYYNPGSTIKPLDGVAALAEGVITPDRHIFSPGYILVPNQYNSSTPTKYLDWQYQGSVDLASALAQSSDVYFYVVGGGSPASTPMLNDPSDYGISGLGITRLDEWWKKFGLGKPTGIDMPGEAEGFLPTPEWKKSHSGTPWLLGDTYNVSIGQGSLLLSPVQLLDYISSIANGGKVLRPFLNSASTEETAEDLTQYASEIAAVQKGMQAGVSTPRGTAYTLHDLPFTSCAKTGSAQVQQNTEENALFVGYAPCSNPQIAILVLIENSREGSLNAVPIAKDVLNWYYENRLAVAPKNSGVPASTAPLQ